MPKLIILASGRKQSGKDTFCQHVLEIYRDALNGSCSADVMSFADPIKHFCIEVIGLSFKQMYGTDEEKNSLTDLEWRGLPHEIRLGNAGDWPTDDGYTHTIPPPKAGGMTAREVMQVFGTDIMRRWKEDVWVQAAVRQAIQSDADLVLFNDMRFPNELEAFEGLRDKGHNVKFVRLLRNVRPDDRHESEIAMDRVKLDRFDLIVPDQPSVDDQMEFVLPVVTDWLGEAGLI